MFSDRYPYGIFIGNAVYDLRYWGVTFILLIIWLLFRKRLFKSAGWIIVISFIVSSFSGVVLPGFTGMTDDAKGAKAKESMHTMGKAIMFFEKSEGKKVFSLSNLVPTQLAKLPKDPWNSDYQYIPEERKILSAGVDRKFGTPDDITFSFKEKEELNSEKENETIEKPVIPKRNQAYFKEFDVVKKQYTFENWKKMYSEITPQFAPKNCDKVKQIVDDLIHDLAVIGKASSEEKKVAEFKKAVLDLNEIESKTGIIETGEREELCFLLDEIAKIAGLDPNKYGGGEGIASEWRDW